MEFNIGDRVRVKKYDELPEHMRNPACARLCGKDGEIVDKLWSGARECTIYTIHFDNMQDPSTIAFLGNEIGLVSDLDKKEYGYEFDFLDRVVVAILYEYEDDRKTEVARGHGHIIHEGVAGVAQAASYALKKIYQALENY